MQLWDIETPLPYQVNGALKKDHDGKTLWIVVLKKGWEKYEGGWREMEQSPAIYSHEQYMGEKGFSAISFDTDIVPQKKNTDILVLGRARSHAKRPVAEMQCQLLVDGHIDKTLRVVGERGWFQHARSAQVNSAAMFVERDISYSEAIGGEDGRNRLGCGVADSLRLQLEQRVPSVFYPGEDWSSDTSQVRVAGFGVLPIFFDARSRFAGTFDQAWQDWRRPLLPEDFNPAFYQSAPNDQQCNGFLQGGERIAVSGFSHEGILEFELPKQAYQATAYIDKSPQTAFMDLHSIYIVAEQEQVHASWCVAFECCGKDHLLEKTIVTMRQV
ncbi:DUF2169 domain-containing protein [Thaumasiovibrio sp. DFM-14]|uniref:DUF2169 family type VI secretion system accessory protein n=1 Tax=Thaumasiovibrio sp. DFM-14 TaxID=3384792 RepID=UPI0039A1E10B